MIFKRVIVAISTCLLGSAVGLADPVGFYTVGVFSNDPGGTATNQNAASNWTTTAGTGLSTSTMFLSSGGYDQIIFAAQNQTNPLVLPPSTISLGSFMTVPLSNFGTPKASDFTGVNFNLEIFQTAPSTGSSTFFGELTGKLGYVSTSNGGSKPIDTLTWTPSSNTIAFTENGVTDFYTLLGLDSNGALEFSSQSTVLAQLTQTPEPGNLGLLGTGLLLLAGLLRRRFA
jgi:hypothetical protein